ncbi:hypothetical protein [Mesorhizobium sp.]|uniref:hypothetical protein n=1 Tax=Mesorhizobium sp. TaxID=1871066 RepID=UPI0025CFC834|nr:hypothetical protein [Mesorhizobium sp.]
MPELVHLSNRVYVMGEGRIVAELKADGITEATVLLHYFDAETSARQMRPHTVQDV